MMETWVQTSETDDVAGSIRHVIRTAHFVGEDPQAWKWVVMALHSALQGACVCHLTTTAAPVGAVTEQNASAWLTYFENSHTDSNTKPPETHLMALPGLLKAVRKPHSAGDHTNALGITISDSDLMWLGRFHKQIRNQFVHFEPMGWSINMSGIPELVKLIARIIEEILDHGWAFRHQDLEERSDMRRSLKTLATIDWPD